MMCYDQDTKKIRNGRRLLTQMFYQTCLNWADKSNKQVYDRYIMKNV